MKNVQSSSFYLLGTLTQVFVFQVFRVHLQCLLVMMLGNVVFFFHISANGISKVHKNKNREVAASYYFSFVANIFVTRI